MKIEGKIKKFFVIFILLQIIVAEGVAFAEAPYNTKTAGPFGKILNSPAAYEPFSYLSLGFNGAEDLFLDENSGKIYLTDTLNKRVLVIKNDQIEQVIGEGILEKPTGIFVANNKVYVADYDKEKIVIFTTNGELIQEFARPKEVLFGKENKFVPLKVAVDGRGNIYVVSEGSVNGLIQLNPNGNFLGFIGANKTNITFSMLLRNIFFTKEQKAQLFMKVPPSPTNITIDQQGLVYTVTNGILEQGIKKLNVLGINILPSKMHNSSNLVDIAVDGEGNIFTVDQNGYLALYDSFGNFLFLFGSFDQQNERKGFLKVPSALTVTKDGKYLYALDKELNLLIKYRITPYAQAVFQGVKKYKDGLYLESENDWKEVLRYNSNFILGYRSLAKAEFKKGNYATSLQMFMIAEDKQGYSEAYWQIRNEWLQNNLARFLIYFVVFLISLKILRYLNRRLGIIKLIEPVSKFLRKQKLLAELKFSLYFLRHPIDAVYEMKFNQKATVLSATLLYLYLICLNIALKYLTGYLFRTDNLTELNLLTVILEVTIPLFFWIISNYLVSTINDGEGKFSQVYIGTIYALSPYLIFSLPISILSNFLTYNEAFIYNYSMFFLKAWSVVLIFLLIKELHNFSLGETIKNILLTIFTIIILALLLFIITLLFKEELTFIRGIIEEVSYRVK